MSTRAVERRIVTVLFADLVGFTSLSERLDAEDVSIVQDAYFEAVREAVHRHGGLLEKFVGDAAMAVFGAPTAHDDDAERAVGAGLALVAAIERVGAQLALDPGTLRLRVGIASGEAVYGEATAERGPVTGDTVNVAARLQAAAEPGTVVVGEVTALAVSEAVELDPVGPLELKGKTEPVRGWRVVGFRAERSREAALGDLRAPMIGRDAELGRLRTGLGTTRLELVVAPPGVGKSRLLTELAAELAGSGAVVLRAQLRPDLLSPFEPVGQLVRSAGLENAAERLRAAGIGEARAAVVLESLEAVVAPAGAAPTGSTERDQLFAAWLEGLEALSGSAPEGWLVEDVHWASPDVLAFLADAVEAGQERLVVATARPALLETAPGWCATAELLHLAPLPAADVGALIHALVDDALRPEFVERIAERSGGNALFVEELLRTWIGTGVRAREDGGGWALAADLDEVGLPPTVQAIYAAQLDDLAPSARTAARHASVAGRRFPIESLPELAARATARHGLREPGAGRSCDAPSRLRQLARWPEAERPTERRLLAGLTYERTPLERRHRVRRVRHPPTEALPGIAEVIARHYASAIETAPTFASGVGGRDRGEIGVLAGTWFEQASDVAGGVAAWESARTLAERALEFTPEDEPLARARRLEQLARASQQTIGVTSAEAFLREALSIYREHGDRDGIASAGLALGHLLRAQTRFEDAVKLADELLEEIGEAEDAATAVLLLLRGLAKLNSWDDFKRALEDYERALILARRVGDPDLEFDALELTTELRAERGDVVDWGEVEQAARVAGRWSSVSDALRAQALGLTDDEPERVPPLVAEARMICRRVASSSLWAGATTCSSRRGCPPATGTTPSRPACGPSSSPRSGASRGSAIASGSRSCPWPRRAGGTICFGERIRSSSPAGRTRRRRSSGERCSGRSGFGSQMWAWNRSSCPTSRRRCPRSSSPLEPELAGGGRDDRRRLARGGDGRRGGRGTRPDAGENRGVAAVPPRIGGRGVAARPVRAPAERLGRGRHFGAPLARAARPRGAMVADQGDPPARGLE